MNNNNYHNLWYFLYVVQKRISDLVPGDVTLYRFSVATLPPFLGLFLVIVIIKAISWTKSIDLLTTSSLHQVTSPCTNLMCHRDTAILSHFAMFDFTFLFSCLSWCLPDSRPWWCCSLCQRWCLLMSRSGSRAGARNWRTLLWSRGHCVWKSMDVSMVDARLLLGKL